MTALPFHERLQDLLLDRAVVGLDASEHEELQRLLAESGDAAARADEFDLAAAALTLGLGVAEESLPAHLSAQIEDAASAVVGRESESAVATAASARSRSASSDANASPAVIGRVGFAPWLVAAAALVVAVVGWMQPGAPTSDATTPLSDQFAALQATPGVISIDWQALDDPTAEGASGEVIWSEAEQRGFMRFAGLATNDPSESQYQLWIFDATRPEATPVDGGVFDISASGEVIVPIDAALPIREATAFAVTIESPGGVVVSDRSRVALLAARG